MKGVVREIFFDQIAFVPEADDEIVDPVMGVDLHDVPDDRAAADLHHRLRANGGFFGEAGAKAPGENDGLQELSSVVMVGDVIPSGPAAVPRQKGFKTEGAE
jgi:hypothetical protein